MISLRNVAAILAYKCQVEKKGSDGQSPSPRDGETWSKTELALQAGLRRLPGAWFPQLPSGLRVPQLRFTAELGPPSGRRQIKSLSWNMGSYITRRKPVAQFLTAFVF